MKKVIMSNLYPSFCNAVKSCGYKIINSDTVQNFHQPEQKHADMQVLRIKDTTFILNECVNLKTQLKNSHPVVIKEQSGKLYPENVRLNCLYLNGKLYGKLDAIANEVKCFCNENDIHLVNVNQGYTKCSTLVVGKNAVITSDISIYKAMCKNGVEVLLISSGQIILEGFDYGFIGGAGFYDNNTVYFFGNAELHPDYHKIKNFCENHNSKIEILSSNFPLTDIGGVVII